MARRVHGHAPRPRAPSCGRRAEASARARRRRRGEEGKRSDELAPIKPCARSRRRALALAACTPPPPPMAPPPPVVPHAGRAGTAACRAGTACRGPVEGPLAVIHLSNPSRGGSRGLTKRNALQALGDEDARFVLVVHGEALTWFRRAGAGAPRRGSGRAARNCCKARESGCARGRWRRITGQLDDLARRAPWRCPLGRLRSAAWCSGMDSAHFQP